MRLMRATSSSRKGAKLAKMKDKSVTDVVLWLEENLHRNLLAVDHWEADASASLFTSRLLVALLTVIL